jgi:hypothetical protein
LNRPILIEVGDYVRLYDADNDKYQGIVMKVYKESEGLDVKLDSGLPGGGENKCWITQIDHVAVVLKKARDMGEVYFD